ncbi:MAG: DUF4139 domain-containing protein [candidate division Zixibacteria bacterium]|nr:DUF4139 domain-containing protein [candidate division Zixibacteria bacterium]
MKKNAHYESRKISDENRIARVRTKGSIVFAIVAFSFALPCVTHAQTTGMSVTVYNSDLAVIRESRSMIFRKGLGQVAFRDVPSRIDPTSVGFKTLRSSESVRILEQNYQFDLVSPEKIYDRYINENIELFSKDGKIYSGELLAKSGQSVILRDGSEQVQIVLFSEITNVNFPELPEGLITQPTLLWKYNSDVNGSVDCEVSYQTSGMSWSAEYVALLNEAETSMDLSAWASIDNRSGKTYSDATLKLVAGDIHRAPKIRGGLYKGAAPMAMEYDGGFQEKSFFEYHLYTLPRKSTLANNEIKQLSLFDPASANITKEYHYNSGTGAKNISVKIIFENTSDNGLGMPLPGGRVRLFKADDDGSIILLGEDRISHTPRDEKITLTVGNAFDIVAEEKTLDRRAISKKVTEYDYEISLRNRKDDDVEIKVFKFLGVGWEILESSHDFEKKQANKIEFKVHAPAGKETKLTFTARYTTP